MAEENRTRTHQKVVEKSCLKTSAKFRLCLKSLAHKKAIVLHKQAIHIKAETVITCKAALGDPPKLWPGRPCFVSLCSATKLTVALRSVLNPLSGFQGHPFYISKDLFYY